MAASPVTVPLRTPERTPDHVPAEWSARAQGAVRDEALDLVRGLAIAVLVFNHVALVSGLEFVTGAVFSAAEVLVAVSGVVVGMVFGRRWLLHGARATSALLLRRSRKLYLASVVVVAVVGLLTLVPGLATQALTGSASLDPAVDNYAYDSLPRLLLAIVTLEAGPWQFNILGFFIASIAVAPIILWALARGWWPWVLAASAALYFVGNEFHPDVLPFQSERPFPILIWQVLFVGGMVVGWHRADIAAQVGRYRKHLFASIAVAGAACALWLIGMQVAMGNADWEAWERLHFDKGTLDLVRIPVVLTLTAAAYLLFRHFQPSLGRVAAPVLLPLGQNSFYVFIMHVFVCLAVASLPLLATGGLGLFWNSLIEVGCLALLWLMVKRRFLFSVVPR